MEKGGYGDIWGPSTWPVRGDLTSTLTGGPLDSAAPQLKQNLASSAFGLPHAWHGIIIGTYVEVVLPVFNDCLASGESASIVLPSEMAQLG